MEVIVQKNIAINLKIQQLKSVEYTEELAEIRDISKQAELMIVIGDKESTKTKELYDISIKGCNNAMIVEKIEDLYINYVERFKKVGIVIGECNNNELIKEIIEIVQKTKTR